MNYEPSRPSANDPWSVQIPTQRNAPPGLPAQAPKPPKNPRRWPWGVGGLAVGLLVGGAIASATVPSTAVTAAASAPARTVTVTAPPPPPRTITVTVPAPPPETVTVEAPRSTAAGPSGPLTTFGEGTWEVGVDIAPGKYKTTGSTGISCYYARLKQNDGSLHDIIDNNIQDGPVTVVIKSSDGYFETRGCEDWVKAG